MQARTEAQQLLGFLGLFPSVGQDGFLGALLITDNQGVPQEFRCTHPVKPTLVQRPLYGDALEPYVGVSLCGTRLIESVQHKPSLLIVNKEYLTGVRDVSPCPVLFVQKAGEALEISPRNGAAGTSRKARIDCTTGKFQPIVLSTHPEFEEDLEMGREAMTEIFAHLDPVEPFERMRQAIEVLAKQDAKFR